MKMIHLDARKIVQKLVNPHFYEVFTTDKPNIALKGGRASTKSSVISIKLLLDFLSDPEGNVVVLRKVAGTLGTSVYEQIKWAIYQIGLDGEFIFRKAPVRIIHRRTDTAFYFFGVDDPQKIKSAAIAKGYISALWFEEAAEYDREDIDIVQDTFIRADVPGQVRTFYSWNPPRNKHHWVNEWIREREKNPDFYVNHSTYLNDEKGFLSDQLIRKIEQYKENDYSWYEWMYLGRDIGLGTSVYNMDLFQKIPAIPPTHELTMIDLSIDSGYSISACTFLAIGYLREKPEPKNPSLPLIYYHYPDGADISRKKYKPLDVVLLDTYYYDPTKTENKKSPGDIADDLARFRRELTRRFGVPVDSRPVIDSADAGLRQQLINSHGIYPVPVRKEKKAAMIEKVQELLVQKRFFILDTKANEIFYDEHRKYEWKEGTTDRENPAVIKEHDHTVDAFMYWCMMRGNPNLNLSFRLQGT